LSTIDSVYPSVCHALSNCFFHFVPRWNQAIFGRQFSMWHFTKRCSWIFDLGPLTPKIYSPKFAQNCKSLSRLVWQIDRRYLGLLGVFRGWPFNGTMQNVVEPTLVAMATKFGLGEEILSPTGLLLYDWPSLCVCICCFSICE